MRPWTTAGITLLLRDVSDPLWNAALSSGADGLMRRFSSRASHSDTILFETPCLPICIVVLLFDALGKVVNHAPLAQGYRGGRSRA
jgi:hypothetical protein